MTTPDCQPGDYRMNILLRIFEADWRNGPAQDKTPQEVAEVVARRMLSELDEHARSMTTPEKGALAEAARAVLAVFDGFTSSHARSCTFDSSMAGGSAPDSDYCSCGLADARRRVSSLHVALAAHEAAQAGRERAVRAVLDAADRQTIKCVAPEAPCASLGIQRGEQACEFCALMWSFVALRAAFPESKEGA